MHCRERTLALAVIALFATSEACPAGDRVVADRPLMGTSFRIIVEAENSEPLQAAIAAAFAKAAMIEAACSDYRDDSEVSALIGLNPADTLMISPLFADVMKRALELSEITEGAYDPTLGALTMLWRESVKTKQLPKKSALNDAMAVSGYAHLKLSGGEHLPKVNDTRLRSAPPTSHQGARCSLSAVASRVGGSRPFERYSHFAQFPELSLNFEPCARNTISIKRAGLRVDLGGIAKGYAADAMHDVLRDAGFETCAIIAGGDVRVGAPPEGKSGWKIALRTLKRDVDDTIIILANAAVSTSGGLYQSVNIDGANYSHILDPSSGLGLTDPIAASVIAHTATLSDALATAACVAGPERAVNDIKKWGGIDVRVVTQENNTAKVVMSKGFAKRVFDSTERER